MLFCCFSVTFRVLTRRFLDFSWGPGGFRELREAGSNHFHLSWFLLVPGVTSCDQQTKKIQHSIFWVLRIKMRLRRHGIIVSWVSKQDQTKSPCEKPEETSGGYTGQDISVLVLRAIGMYLFSSCRSNTTPLGTPNNTNTKQRKRTRGR